MWFVAVMLVSVVASLVVGPLLARASSQTREIRIIRIQHQERRRAATG
jgi:hypothetical protein